MPKFEVGDKVRVVDEACILEVGKELTIVPEDDSRHLYGEVEGEIEIGYVNIWPQEFELIERIKKNDDGTVNVMVTVNSNDPSEFAEGMDDFIANVRKSMVDAINKQPNTILTLPHPGAYLDVPSDFHEGQKEKPELGVYRPNLEDRKVGKVGMHMFIDGFPNAMYEVAKVMQWAADVKGYKLHDWKNLPDAEIALSSAGYRHMVDNAVQRAAGVAPLDRVDHESNLLHLAHQAFNILAQIELIATKKIS